MARKNWILVRPDLCRLYAAGASLREVREQISELHGFEASARAYRLMLKKWEAKRPRIFKSSAAITQGEREPPSNSNPPLPSASPEQSLGSDVQGVGSAQVLPAFDANIERVVHGRTGVRESCFCMRSTLDVDIEHISEWLKADEARELPGEMQQRLLRDGVDSAIHAAARRLEMYSVLNFISNFAARQNMSLDVRDCDGATALEISIRTDNWPGVVALIRSGASVNLFNRDGLAPLHVGICAQSGKFSSMLMLLLEHGADVDSPTIPPDNFTGQRPLDMAMSFLGSSADWSDMQAIYSLVSHILRRAHPDVQRDTVSFTRFLAIQSERGKIDKASIQSIEPVVLECYRLFLRRGQDALATEWPDTECRTHAGGYGCRTLAANALFHAPDVALSEVILDCCSAASGRELKKLILSGVQAGKYPQTLETVAGFFVCCFDKPLDLLQKTIF